MVVHDQSFKSNTILIDSVNAEKAGWIVITTDQNGKPGAVLGYAAVPAGVSNNIKINIDSSKATGTLIAVLHIDAGKIGAFEYPGPDAPVMNGSTAVMVVINDKATA